MHETFILMKCWVDQMLGIKCLDKIFWKWELVSIKQKKSPSRGNDLWLSQFCFHLFQVVFRIKYIYEHKPGLDYRFLEVNVLDLRYLIPVCDSWSSGVVILVSRTTSAYIEHWCTSEPKTLEFSNNENIRCFSWCVLMVWTDFAESLQQAVNDVWNEKFLSSAQSEYIQFCVITVVLGYLF